MQLCERLVTAMCAWVIVGGGCTTFLYRGPSRSASEVSVILSSDTIVDKVDDVMVRDRSSGSLAHLEVLPGPHRLGISLNRVTPGPFVTNVARSGIVVACVALEAGHTYKTVPDIGDGRFSAKVLDTATNMYVDTRCWNDRPTSATAEAAGAPPAVTDGDVAPPTPAVAEPAADTSQPLAAVPSIARRTARVRLPSDAELSGRQPGSGLSLFFGGAFGGEDFVKATDSNGNSTTLSSGGGAIAGMGLMLTPAWAGESVGFGLGLHGAIKYDHVGASNGSASITRYPVALTAHLLANVSEGIHYIILKGGVSRDFGVNYSSSGFATIDANVSGTWGPAGAIGYYKRSNDVFGWDILGVFALEKHVIGTERINANSFGVTMGVHWRP